MELENNEENKTYRFLRREPTILGLPVPRFFLFLGIIVMGSIIIFALFSFPTVILGAAAIGGSYVYLSKPRNSMNGTTRFPDYIQKYGNSESD